MFRSTSYPIRSTPTVGRASVALTVVTLALASVAAFAFAPDLALAAPGGGQGIGSGLTSLLKGTASQVFVGIVAIVSIIFLINRKYSELMLFFGASVIVAMLVFNGAGLQKLAEKIGKALFG